MRVGVGVGVCVRKRPARVTTHAVASQRHSLQKTQRQQKKKKANLGGADLTRRVSPGVASANKINQS